MQAKEGSEDNLESGMGARTARNLGGERSDTKLSLIAKHGLNY
jgi:hypothetical protein